MKTFDFYLAMDLRSDVKGIESRMCVEITALKNIKESELDAACEVANDRLICGLKHAGYELTVEEGRLDAKKNGKTLKNICVLPTHPDLLEERPRRIIQIFDQRGKDFSEVLKEIDQDLLVKVDYQNKRILHKKNNSETYFWIWVG